MRHLPLVLLAACASTTTSIPKGGPRGLRASDHMAAARQHDEAANAARKWPDAYGDRAAYNIPWTRSWDSGVEEERLAAIHRTKAAQLQIDYEEACRDRTPEQASVSPLQRYGIGGWNTTSGVVLYLTPDAGSPDKLMADMKCHRAWMMLGPAGMEDCPLDLPGIEVDARGDADGISVSIVVRDSKLVDELHRRAARELESANTSHEHE